MNGRICGAPASSSAIAGYRDHSSSLWNSLPHATQCPMLTLPPHAVLNFIFLKPVFNKRINFTNSFCVWLQACISYSRAIHATVRY